MKKFFALFVLVLLIIFQPNAQASYPDHLNGDPDYVCTDGHMGAGWYMKKSSLNVESYSPPIYVISVSVYTVNDADRGNTNYTKVETFRFRYDWDSRSMYVQTRDKDWNYSWRYLDPNGSWAKTGISMPTGEMAFYVAYRQKFYGQFYGRYDSKFYARAD